MILNNSRRLEYGLKEYFIVLVCILLSKSLYYETYGTNILLGIFLLALMLMIKPWSVKVNQIIVLYSLFMVLLIGLNPETKYSSFLVLLLRMLIGVYVLCILDFNKFSAIYIKIILAICVVSLLSFPVIYFNIPSPLPDFIGLDDRPLRNFIFFGVSEPMIQHGVYRNSGLWWEPGAFQVFVNIAFVFALINKTVNKKVYIIIALTIISTLSTTGVLVFILLSSIYWWRYVSVSRNKMIYFIVVFFLIVLVVLVGIPFILVKFGLGSNSAGESVSFLSRYYDFLISYNMLMDNPLFGYGFGSQIENAIPYGIDYMGIEQYEFINPTGSDGLSMFVAQCGLFSLVLLYPLIFPRYLSGVGVVPRLIVCISIILLFNTENFTYILIFSLLTMYGIAGTKFYNYPDLTSRI